jgi:glycosyltransferase involved in cell wall biosynthesis
VRIALNAWFIDRPETGSGQYLAHLLAEYAAQHAGHQFLLCMPGGQAPAAVARAWEQAAPGRTRALDGFERRVLRTPPDRWRGTSSRLGRHLAKLWFEQVSFPAACRRWGADLIHVPYWGAPLWGSAPRVVTVHDIIPVLLPAYSGGALGRGYNRLVTWSARRAAGVLTDSQASRQDIIRHLGIAPERVVAIHLAAAERFRPLQDGGAAARVRARYGLPERYLLYLGGFDVRKNVPGVLRAFARLDAPGVHLVIAGRLPGEDSPFFPHPERVAGELGIRERVRFTGWVDGKDKPALYSGAIALVFPSYYEGFGLPPLEAMACGTPAIVSDRGSLPEVVGDGGLCVSPDDTEALAQAMRALIVDRGWREAKSRAALAQAGRFSWPRAARETMAAYRRVLAEED